MSSGHRLLSAFRFLSYPIKIIKVIIHKHKISKSKDKKYAVIGVRTFKIAKLRARGLRSYHRASPTVTNIMIKEYNVQVSETVLPIYINGQCPIIKTCSDVTLNLSSKDSISCILLLFTFVVNLRLVEINLLKIHHLKRCPLSKSNFFYQNFMKLGHIV